MSDSQRIRFPYMIWAHESAVLSSYCLSQSGMPNAAPDFLGGMGVDLGHASIEALPAFEERLARLFGVSRERVLVTLGASSAMHLIALRYMRPGAVVAAEVPSYEPLRALPGLMGAELRPLARRLEQGWLVEPEQVRGLLRGCDASKPGHVFMTNLHNPSGVLMEADRVRAVAKEAEAAGGLCVSCEVYMEYLPNERRVHAFDLAPNAISIGSLTKAYGLGALRLGWMILSEGLTAERDLLRDMAYLSFVDPPTSTLQAGVAALDQLPLLLQPLARVERESRPHFLRWLEDTDGVEATLPEFGIIAFPRIVGVTDTVGLADFLQREFDVDTVPGEFFGQAGHLRLGCAVPEATLIEGLERLERGIHAWREQRPL